MEEKNTVPAAIPPAGTDDNPARRNRRPVVIGVAAAAAVVLAVGGVCAHRAYEGHQVSVARQACQSAVADQAKAMKAYRALLDADGTVAALKTDAKSVKDARTVDTLAKAAKADLPTMAECDASKAADLDAAAARASKAAKDVKSDTKALEEAVKAVETSKLDKTVADANALYKATDGKVQDNKTRDALAKAVKARDAIAIAKAVKAVNDSKAAKEKADAEAAAKAQAEQEAQAQAAAAQAQQQAQSYTYTPSYSGARSSGSAGGYSYSKPSGGSTGSSSGSTGGSSDGFVPISGAHGCTDDCPPPSSDGLIHH